MTDIAFHFNVPDRMGYACRLLRKAVAGGHRVWVTASAETLLALDEKLWTFSATDFVPHCHADAPAAVSSHSAVILAETSADALFHDILLNLGAQVPAGFEAFARVIELVTLDEDDRQQARVRWKSYAKAGFALTRHDLQAGS